jgi:CheY-like chemotaxis protein
VPCEVLIHSSGEEAHQKLESGGIPNLIILDINLPGISGAEVLKKLKANEKWKSIPVFPYSSLWNEKTDLPFNATCKWSRTGTRRRAPAKRRARAMSLNNCRVCDTLVKG